MSSAPPPSGGLGSLNLGSLTDQVKAGQDAKAAAMADASKKRLSALPKPVKIGVAALLVALLAGAGWFFLLRGKGGEPTTPTSTSPSVASAPTTNPAPSAPRAASSGSTPTVPTGSSAVRWSGTVIRSGTEWGSEGTDIFMVNEPGYGQVQVEIAGISTPGIGAGVPALAVKAGAMLAGRTVTVTSAIKVELGGAGQDRHRYKEATVTVGGEDLAEKLVSAGLATRRS